MLVGADVSPISPRAGEGDLYGLADGVAREDLEIKEGRELRPLTGPPGANRDGTVPARARRVCCGKLSGVGNCANSGNPSVGDSGIFSRRGVEFPLVGGPQTLTGRPSCACNSLVLSSRVVSDGYRITRSILTSWKMV